jgi:hypothetical protein
MHASWHETNRTTMTESFGPRGRKRQSLPQNTKTIAHACSTSPSVPSIRGRAIEQLGQSALTFWPITMEMADCSA